MEQIFGSFCAQINSLLKRLKGDEALVRIVDMAKTIISSVWKEQVFVWALFNSFLKRLIGVGTLVKIVDMAKTIFSSVWMEQICESFWAQISSLLKRLKGDGALL